ncbi:MAG: DUF1579 domain-containing protein [Gemmataceae bacterium]|nr:DUF1579 domain-containing protein [Gemmataceae bacterium]
MRKSIGVLGLLLLSCVAFAQQPQTPGKEHERLKQMEGAWETVLEAGGMKNKGTTVCKMAVGGMWLVSDLECDMGGLKYYGKGLDSYDSAKKKYVSTWHDSMSGSPMVFVGDYDAAKKIITMSSEGPGPDGKTTKWKSVTQLPDADNMHFSMFVGDGKEPMFTVTYKRKK